MSRVQQSTSGGWHYPGVNFSQSPQQRPPPAQQQQYYSQPPSAPQYPRQQQGQRGPLRQSIPAPAELRTAAKFNAAPSYQQGRGHAPANFEWATIYEPRPTTCTSIATSNECPTRPVLGIRGIIPNHPFLLPRRRRQIMCSDRTIPLYGR